jgi:protein TonB
MKIQLPTFIAVSCLAHAALLLWPNQPPTPQLHIGGHAEALRITLATAPTPVPAAKEVGALETLQPETFVQQRQHPRTATEPLKRSPKRSNPSNAQPAITPANTVSGGVAVTEPAAITPQSSAQNVSERVSAALQNQLAERFEYPWLARKRGWQGLVTLSLHIDESGGVSQWRIARTSGYNLLDRSALEAARHIDRLQQADRLLGGKSLNLSLPVRYQLTDS